MIYLLAGPRHLFPFSRPLHAPIIKTQQPKKPPQKNTQSSQPQPQPNPATLPLLCSRPPAPVTSTPSLARKTLALVPLPSAASPRSLGSRRGSRCLSSLSPRPPPETLAHSPARSIGSREATMAERKLDRPSALGKGEPPDLRALARGRSDLPPPLPAALDWPSAQICDRLVGAPDLTSGCCVAQVGCRLGSRRTGPPPPPWGSSTTPKVRISSPEITCLLFLPDSFRTACLAVEEFL